MAGPGPGAAERIRLGMVGGGEGAFIGAVHRIAARFDDHYDLVAGAFSATPDKAMRSGAALGLAQERVYASFAEMARVEASRVDGIEAVAIVTPNHLHAAVARAFLAAGVHVICDKPVTTNSADAVELRRLARDKGLVLAVTYNYTGHPLVREARELARGGALGAIRVIQVEYAQDWLSEAVEASGQKQAEWRTDPERAGGGGCIGDIGTHAYNLAEFVTGLSAAEVYAELTSFVPGRRVDDNAQILIRYLEGARGTLWASQVAPGNDNNLVLRVYGTKAGLAWRQEEPNQLMVSPLGEPARIISRGSSGAGAAAARASRLPPGHPEGYLDAFATIYAEIARAIRARRAGTTVDPAVVFPDIDDGIAGVRFVEAALRSSKSGGWERLAPAT